MEKVLLLGINIDGNFLSDNGVLMPKVPNKYDAVTIHLEPVSEVVLAERSDLKCVKSGATMPFGDKLLSTDIYRYLDKYWALAKTIDGNRAF